MSKGSAGKNLNFHLLAQFEVLVQERHVSRAADRMGVSQSTMSTALARLRELFADPLLVRTAKGMVPTAKALELAQRTHQALELLEPTRLNSTVFDPASSTRHFRILAPEGLAQLFAPRIAAHLRAHAPGMQLSIQPADMRRTVEALRDQECDLTISNIPHAPADLRKILIYAQRACCIVSANHPEVKARLTMKQYLKYPHVYWGAETASLRSVEASVMQALEHARGLRARPMRVPNILNVAAVVAATDMIATVPSRIADEAMGLYAIRKVQPPMKLPDPDISMYWHELTQRDPGHVWFRGMVVDIARSIAPAQA
jgi:DNA-binding transcriptional LysR family regulator